MIPDSQPALPDDMAPAPPKVPHIPAAFAPQTAAQETAQPASPHSRPVGSFMENILAAARNEEATLPSTLSTPPQPDTAEAAENCPIAPRELPDGTHLHGYRVLRTIGSGGFGVTYLAQEAKLNRTVVIKESFPDSLCYRHAETLDVCLNDPENGLSGAEWARHNFLREVRLLATLDHPCIAKVYSYFEEHQTAYYVIEYINGISLANLATQYAQRGTGIPQSALFGLMVRLLDAFDYLHNLNVLHRDIKPDNILINRSGLPVIIDFGAARESYGDLSNSIVETPGFSPSEQSRPDGHMGPWTDLYAFGATLYYILTGTCLPSCQQRELYDTADPLASNETLCKHYNKALLTSIDRAIDPISARRYQNVAEWMQDLAAIRL